MNLHPREYTPEEERRGREALKEVDKRLQRYFAIKTLSESAESVLVSDCPIESFRDVIEGARSVAEQTGFSFTEAVAQASLKTYKELSASNTEVTQESITDFFIDEDIVGDRLSEDDRESIRAQVDRLHARIPGTNQGE